MKQNNEIETAEAEALPLTDENGEILEAVEETAQPSGMILLDDSGLSGELTGKATSYCSMPKKTAEDRKRLFNVMNNPDFKIKSEINKTIVVKDVFVEMITIKNKETQVPEIVPRVVLIDANGKSHQAVSVGIFSSLKRLIQVMGEPQTWEEPVPVTVIERQVGKGSMLSFTIDMF